jgi:hypothetical protein
MALLRNRVERSSALGRRGSNAQSHFPSPGVKRSIALGRRGSNAQSHFPSPAPTQNSEWESAGF